MFSISDNLIQIIGSELSNAFEELKVKAELKYKTESDWLGISFEAWELSEEDLKKLEESTWKEEYGWYRTSECNDMNNIVIKLVKDKPLKVFDNVYAYETKDFDNLSVYFEDFVGISKYDNFVYYMNTLARINNISKADILYYYI